MCVLSNNPFQEIRKAALAEVDAGQAVTVDLSRGPIEETLKLGWPFQVVPH